jgi:hemolysin D
MTVLHPTSSSDSNHREAPVPAPGNEKAFEAPPAQHPVIELLARYKAIFSAAWAMRHQLAGPKRLADEVAFLPAALSLQDTPVHPAPRRLAFAIVVLFLIGLVWACLGQVDIVAVAQGRIVVSERTKLIQPLERSVVKRVLVKDGDRVVAGQPLVELDPTTASADKASIEEQLKSTITELMRSRQLLQLLSKSELSANVIRGPSGDLSQISAELLPRHWTPAERATTLAQYQTQVQAEWGDISAKLVKLNAESARRQAEIATVQATVVKLETTLPLSRAREDDIKDLAEQGYVTRHTGLDRTRERIELERDLSTQRARLVETQATLAESQSARASYMAETRRTLRDREAQADLKRQQATQEQAKATQREKLTTLTAPVAGVVQQLAVHTIGGVVTEAQALMVIVPEAGGRADGGAPVTAEVTLDNKDIGFVNAGQVVEVKFETFPYTRYGTVPATVQRVTADAVLRDKRGEGGASETAVFPATLALSATHINIDGKQIRLSPGLALTAEIKTGKRRVIEYLLSPIQKAGQESLRER